MTPRREPLLWLQLIALGAIPLEILLLLLVLAGADPGPVPALERLFVWGMGGLAPMVLLWRQPADCCSLLLAQVPLRGRSPQQLKLSALQDALTPKLLALIGPVALLPLFWTLDDHAALAAAFSPLADTNRLIVLVLTIPLLALLVWQWQQLVQALWLLSRSAAHLQGSAALGPQDVAERRLCLGLPLLLLEPLTLPQAVIKTTASPTPEAQAPPEASVSTADGGAVAIEPEQPAEESDSAELDEEIG